MSQSQKTLVQMLVLLAIAGGIGGYAWFGIYKKDAQTAKQQDHDLRLFAPQKLDERTPDGGSPPAEFSRLTITYQGQTTVVERQGKEWWVTSPVKAKADRLVVDGALSQLQTSKFKATLEENPDQATLTKFGFDKPLLVVEATAQVNGESRSVKLVGGLENTFDGSIYVRRNDEKPVFTAEGGVRFTLGKTTLDLRDKQPFAVDEAKIQKIAVKSVNNDYVLERNADKQWNITRPFAEPADTASISAMISGISGERAQAFPEDSEANRRGLGFDAPLVDTTITLLEGPPVRLRVSRQAVDAGIADAGPGGPSEVFYVIRDDAMGSTLAQVGPGSTQYDRNPFDLKDKTIVRFKREAVTKMVFRDVGGPEIVVTKDTVDASAEAWRVVAPRAGKAKIFKVTSALWTLASAKTLAAGEEKPKDWGKYGLDDKAKSITLYGEDGKQLARFVIGKPVPETPSGFYVRGTRDQVLQSDGSRFGEFPFTLAEVLDEPVPDAGLTTSP
ncbi:MAG: DUF4340 domain-containing protein [Archangium sp.]|nr:DUF4340 domain-containing protein [Archangium sp.]